MPYLGDLINDHKAIKNECNKRKVQIKMHVNFISSNDTGETPTIFVWDNNVKIRSGNETDYIIEKFLIVS